MRIVFMGSPDFAVASLSALVDSGLEVAAVVTQPDKPAGRGLRLTPPPVKEYAAARHIPVFQPAHLRGDDCFGPLAELRPDLLVVAAYGQLLPERFLRLPRIAPINVHASLLPRWRGAAPISWSIIEGDAETGITIMRIIRRMDAGDILLKRATPILPHDTAGSLHDRLKSLGAQCLLEAVGLLEAGGGHFEPQDESRATYAPLLKTETARLDWTWPALACERRIRGLNPWPGAFTTFRGQVCKLWRAEPADPPPDPAGIRPGRLHASARGLSGQGGDGGWVRILSLQLAGRAPVSGEQFANGARFQQEDRFV